MKQVDRIAFVKRGKFSHTNDSVLKQLREQFPRCAVDVIDVAELVPLPHWRTLPALGYSALKHYGLRSLRNKRLLMRSLVYTPAFFSKARHEVLRRLQKSRYLFTFQTQGVFDASLPGTPHFLYTDHTHLVNLAYPAFDRKNLCTADWIALERTVYRNATVNFTMSSNVSRSLIEQYGCDPNNVECVYVGTNAEPDARPREPARANAHSKVILFVGVAWERKGGPILIDAFQRVLKAHPTAELVIVGCRPRVHVPRCTVVGRVPISEVGAYYERAAVFCMPTRIEPFGIVFVEALARGVPVVATRIGALPDFIIDDETGYLVEPENPQALADRLIDLLGDPQRQRRLGERGRELVNTRYTWPSVGAAMRAAIERRLA